MKLTIDQTILDKNGLTLEEFLVLYLGAKDVDIESVSQSLVAKGFADKDLFSSGKLVISDKVKDLISTISIDSDKNVIDKDSVLKIKEEKVVFNVTKPKYTFDDVIINEDEKRAIFRALIMIKEKESNR